MHGCDPGAYNPPLWYIDWRAGIMVNIGTGLKKTIKELWQIFNPKMEHSIKFREAPPIPNLNKNRAVVLVFLHAHIQNRRN